MDTDSNNPMHLSCAEKEENSSNENEESRHLPPPPKRLNLFYSVNGLVSSWLRSISLSYKSITIIYAASWVCYLMAQFLWVSVDQNQREYNSSRWCNYVLNAFADMSLFLFEFCTARDVNKRLKVAYFSFNIFALIFVVVLALFDLYRFQSLSSAYYIANSFYFVGYYILLYLNIVMTIEIIKAFDRIASKCSEDERIALTTKLPVNSRSEAMRNTTKFYSRITSLYKLMEFKLVVIFLFLFAVTFLNLVTVGGTAYYGLVYSCRLILGMIQPLYFQYIVGNIESANRVCLFCDLKVFGVKTSTVIVVLPILSYVLALVRELGS
jgi:hypothetical protein